ncbi:MAG: LamG domain-containing protein [Candidatus Aenigmarchaeota archaeon]|nr:LamG domain-containing protein [Candidatus Aenigmarchaeota archaeon]
MKAVTPVIALVMLLLVTTGLVGISYAWFSGVMSAQTSKVISIPPGGAYCSNGNIKVYALNNGDSAITANDIIVAQVDGVDVLNTPFFGDMASGIVGWWKFDSSSGAVAIDSSSNGNNGDLRPACPDCPSWNAGAVNSLKFDGTNDYVRLPVFTSPTTLGDFTVNAWVYMEAHNPSGRTYFLDFRGDGSTTQNALGMIIDNNAGVSEIHHFLQYNAAEVTEYNAPVPSPIGGWHNFVFSRSGNQLSIYYDGQKITNSFTPSSVAPKSDATSLQNAKRVGTYSSAPAGGNYWMKGYIDDLRVYNKATGGLSIQPGSSVLAIDQPSVSGRHSVRIGTPSGVAETSVVCA